MPRDFLREWWREDGANQESEELVGIDGMVDSCHWSVRGFDGRLRDRYSVPGAPLLKTRDPIRGCGLVRDVDFDRQRQVCIAPLDHETRLPECCTDAYLTAHGEVRLSNDADRYAIMQRADSVHLEGHVWAPLDLVGLVEDHELAAWHRAADSAPHDGDPLSRSADTMGHDVDMATWTRTPGAPRYGAVRVACPDSIMERRTRRRWKLGPHDHGTISRYVVHPDSPMGDNMAHRQREQYIRAGITHHEMVWRPPAPPLA